MKKFYLKLAVFIFLLGVALGSIEAGFRLKSNVFKDKFDGLSSQVSDVEVLCLGHSHIEDGINPELLSYKTYNFGLGFENVYFDDYLLRHFIGNMPSLKSVVLAGSCFHLFNELPDLDKMRGEDLFNTIKFHLYCELDSLKQDRIHPFDPEYNLEILNNPPKAYYEMFQFYMSALKTGFRPYSDFYSTGYIPISNVCAEEFLDRDAIHYTNIHFGKKDARFEKTANYYIYENMARVCQQHNVKFFIVLFPAWHLFWEKAPTNQMEVTRYLFHQLEKEYDNCTLLDYSQDTDFKAGDFRDATHLNCYGAEKMTRKLEEELKRYD